MEKEFIPYEQALALKKLGFNKTTLATYSTKQGSKWILTFDLSGEGQYPDSSPACVAPLYQQAFRWFREKYGLFAEITLWGDGLGFISMIKEIKQEEFIEVYQKAIIDRGLPIWSYEEAELECLKKLIEIIKEKS
jgi:hypothetical protein